MSTYSIRAENLSKQYRIRSRKRRVMLRQAIQDTITSSWDSIRSATGFGQGKVAYNGNTSFWALRNISFDIKAGESVGIIGRNGAGKSTLLKILARVTTPSEGRVRLRGRVGSLLEVGTGFHQELTGRENIYLNGAILGMKHAEIDRKFDEIVDFSEVEEFLDTPVKFFSSGMRMRLAFSVAAHLEPEILLVDEVLAVGDTAFQKKSINKMESIINQGRTVVFVSHNMAVVKSLCKRGLYIEKGQVVYSGDMENAIDQYLGSGKLQNQIGFTAKPDLNKPVQILEVGFDNPMNSIAHFPHDQPITIKITIAVRKTVYRLGIELSILDKNFNPILVSYDFDKDEERLQSRNPGLYTYLVKIPPVLAPDHYHLSIQARQLVHRDIAKDVLIRRRDHLKDAVENICPFELFDNDSPRSRANLLWNGNISIPLDWELIKNIEDEPVTHII